jgi:hypothetical protein
MIFTNQENFDNIGFTGMLFSASIIFELLVFVLLTIYQN